MVHNRTHIAPPPWSPKDLGLTTLVHVPSDSRITAYTIWLPDEFGHFPHAPTYTYTFDVPNKALSDMFGDCRVIQSTVDGHDVALIEDPAATNVLLDELVYGDISPEALLPYGVYLECCKLRRRVLGDHADFDYPKALSDNESSLESLSMSVIARPSMARTTSITGKPDWPDLGFAEHHATRPKIEVELSIDSLAQSDTVTWSASLVARSNSWPIASGMTKAALTVDESMHAGVLSAVELAVFDVSDYFDAGSDTFRSKVMPLIPPYFDHCERAHVISAAKKREKARKEAERKAAMERQREIEEIEDLNRRVAKAIAERKRRKQLPPLELGSTCDDYLASKLGGSIGCRTSIALDRHDIEDAIGRYPGGFTVDPYLEDLYDDIYMNDPHMASADMLVDGIDPRTGFALNSGRRRKVVRNSDGCTFLSVADAAEECGVSKGSLYHAIEKHVRLCGSTWSYLYGKPKRR